jgi:predicted nucleic acid-binding protein
VADQEAFHRVLVDTGPLVAIISARDSQHQRCAETLSLIRPPMLTCWPVLTEAAWLLRQDPTAISKLLSGPQAGLFRLLHLDDHELPEIDKLAKKYRDLKPQLADLTLVHLARRERIETVFTLDQRDFTVYRPGSRTRFQLLPSLSA